MVSVSDVLSSIGSQEIDSLKHYASKYYDPVKAKEYYERTKKLKGREKALTTTQRQASTFAKSNISEARKEETQKNRDTQKARLEKLRANAEAKQTAIKNTLDTVARDFEAKVKAIESPVADVPVNEISPTAPDKVRAFLERQNKHIRDANAVKKRKQDRDQIKQLAAIVKAAREDAAEQRKSIAEDLRAQLQKARDDYAAQVKRTKAKYDNAIDTELKNIRTQVK